MVKKRTMKASLILIGLLITLEFQTSGANPGLLPLHEHNAPICNVTDTSLISSLRIRPFGLEIVPPSTGIQFYQNGIIFLSHSKADEKIPERHISFGSLRIYSSVVKDTIPGPYVPLDLDGTSLFPTEATTFSSDNKTMYLSLIPEGSTSEKIFQANNPGTGWKIEAVPLEICTGDYIYSHPCLSADGTFMIFSSDMPGTTGGLDLFVIRKEENGWGSPQNLGKDVNSPGNELFASLDSRNNLYFSSDGLPGKGGYDVFISRYDGSAWEKAIQLIGTLNSKDDELAFTINRSDDKTAFCTRRANSGKYRTQLFILDINPATKAMGDYALGDCFLANEGTVESTPGAAKINGEEKIAYSAVKQETLKEQTGKNQDAVPTKPATDITGSKKESDSSLKETQTTIEKKNDIAPAAKPVQPVQAPVSKKDEVVYRVQILANTKAVGVQNITMAGKIYKSFEYLYMGGYRTTIGEFSTLSEASRLQAICRQNGYNQAFVVAFKNNIRSNDPELFK